ncbi:glutaredoxin family protein [Streptomyces sp. GC420]|uniref:glutaredoxin family protein n=1 Tax=Streptomyces sp. GC420 TaxID=2697568 RepID=UPI001415279B|nr:glutaredoxin family protein [Streptomyces sp. GC420]NBM18575.1 glutaredoxin family protein [Streptomyces sp. GC420]
MSPMFRTSKKNDAADRVVTLIGRPGCHLCEDAQRVVEKVCAETGAVWESKDITQDAELHRKYWEEIPVVLVDGKQHTFWRVDENRLRRALGAR